MFLLNLLASYYLCKLLALRTQLARGFCGNSLPRFSLLRFLFPICAHNFFPDLLLLCPFIWILVETML
jgi:hypothetical protein